MLRRFLSPRLSAEANQRSQLARTDLTHGINASQGKKCPTLLLPDSYGLKQFEIQRTLRRQCDVAIAGQSCATGTCRGADQRTEGSAFAATSNGPDGRATSGATAHHGCCALDFTFTGHVCTGRLNLMILPVDRDAGQLEGKRSATLETAGGFRISTYPFRPVAFGDGDTAFDF